MCTQRRHVRLSYEARTGSNHVLVGHWLMSIWLYTLAVSRRTARLPVPSCVTQSRRQSPIWSCSNTTCKIAGTRDQASGSLRGTLSLAVNMPTRTRDHRRASPPGRSSTQVAVVSGKSARCLLSRHRLIRAHHVTICALDHIPGSRTNKSSPVQLQPCMKSALGASSPYGRSRFFCLAKRGHAGKDAARSRASADSTGRTPRHINALASGDL